MVCSDNLGEEKTSMSPNIPAEEKAMKEFKASLVRSLKQYNAGYVKTFDDMDEFLDDLHNPE
jgi:hypothetical protein